MELIAHRGVSAHYHENTMLAFEKALSSPVLGIEVDLHQIENEFIIFHDFNLERLLDTPEDINDLSLAQVRALKLKGGHDIPTLSQLFDLSQGKCVLNLELKYIANPVLLIEQITQYIYTYNAELVISSFNHHLLRRIQRLLRDTRINQYVKIGALIGHLPIDLAQYAINLQVDIAIIDADLITKEFVEHAHSYNLDVWAYTVNTKKGLNKLNGMGVNAVFTNDPDLLKTYL